MSFVIGRDCYNQFKIVFFSQEKDVWFYSNLFWRLKFGFFKLTDVSLVEPSEKRMAETNTQVFLDLLFGQILIRTEYKYQQKKVWKTKVAAVFGLYLS